ncbi:hypothetical protein AX14_002985 [Amanita brunnescens Koide BX004]|nr:hypothetical protein AX14_002985 [Amanita brunnescens Koide BX004]
MKFFVLFFLSLFAFVFSLPLVVRDVYDPPILNPNSATVWTVGKEYSVDWDTSNPPAQITNTIGEVYLRKGDLTDVDHPLAGNFSILLGTIRIRVPDVEPGDDYSIVLMGDSGNWSPSFRIVSYDHAYEA